MTPEHKAKLDAIIARDGAEAVAGRVNDLFTAAKVEGVLDHMTDEALADFIEENVAAEMSMVSPLFGVLANCVDRLRRAKGGPNE